MAQVEPPGAVSTSTFSHSGTSTSTLSVSLSDPSSSWTIDSGASHHMTCISSLFSSYHFCFRRDKVHITDRSYSSITRKGGVITSHFMHLFCISCS